MFNTDKPINKISEDKLGRSSFAKQLANAIMQFKTKDNYITSRKMGLRKELCSKYDCRRNRKIIRSSKQ